MFDFTWINANLYDGLYRRSVGFFDDSELSSVGRAASAGERALLKPFPDAVRADVLEGRLASAGLGRLGPRPRHRQSRARRARGRRLQN